MWGLRSAQRLLLPAQLPSTSAHGLVGVATQSLGAVVKHLPGCPPTSSFTHLYCTRRVAGGSGAGDGEGGGGGGGGGAGQPPGGFAISEQPQPFFPAWHATVGPHSLCGCPGAQKRELHETESPYPSSFDLQE